MESDWLRALLHEQKESEDRHVRHMAAALLGILDLAESDPRMHAKVPVEYIRRTITRYFYEEDE